eukprot:TRINITY_DN598_c0_g1_i1.p1 TRINITY_DN598_c0_g1~~TRINITY_DN598_c0_g1_i1.p1  ORF type:complete len:659 (+),score=220.18 TRINITY_DN598_c0_g1_i1:19-1995(+)
MAQNNYAKTTFDPRKPQSLEYFEKEGPVRRHPEFHSKLVDSYEGRKTVYSLIAPVFEQYREKPLFGVRPKLEKSWGEYMWTTYGEAGAQTRNVASGLRYLGLNPKDTVGIYSRNRAEWLITAMASSSQSLVIVPLYDTLGPNAAEFIVNHAELSAVVVGKENLPSLLHLAKENKYLKYIIHMDPLTDATKQQIASYGHIRFIGWDELQKLGAANVRAPTPPEPSDLYCIMYTSGTTGDPKGVMMTHNNVASNVGAVNQLTTMYPNDVHISYLPLAHIYECVTTINLIVVGAAIGFWHGEVTELIDDIQKLKPTLLVAVPRVLNRIYDRIRSTVNNGGVLKRSLFNYGLQAKMTASKTGGDSPFWNKLVFDKVRQLTGGRVRIIVSGAAPLAADVSDFLRAVFSCPVVQGYGLTESSAPAFIQHPNDPTSGHVGSPLPSNECKLVDVPELGYTSRSYPQRGEVCLRGHNIFIGYYKNPQMTKEAIDEDGWFHTGDIGQWTEEGKLKIIDRKKNIFKLAQGEYVAGEFLETIYGKCPYVLQSYVYGDSLKSYLVAVVVPNLENLIPWARQHGINDTKLEDFCNNPRVKKLILQDLHALAITEKLKGFEIIKNVYLESEPWTVENNLLTPSMKLKRPAIKKKYQSHIESLYKEPPVEHSKL